MKKLLIFLSLSLILFSSCRKLTDYPEDAKVALIGKWLVTGSTQQEVKGDKLGIEENTYQPDDVCGNDDLHIFSADDKYSIDYGKEKCDPLETQIELIGTWELTENNKLLTITAQPNQGIEGLITEVALLNDKNLKLRTVAEINDKPYILTTTFTKQK